MFEVTQKNFDHAKKQGNCTSQGHICIEKLCKMVVLLWIHSSRQVGYMFEKL